MTRDNDETPIVTNPVIDDDQRAMAALMGIDVETAQRGWTKYYIQDPAGNRVERCPTVIGEWRGQLRSIARGGCVSIYTPPREPKPERCKPVLRIVRSD